MKNSKFSLLVVLTLVLSLFLTACYGGSKEGASEPKDNGKGTETEETPSVPQELKILESAELPSMDSVMAEDAASFEIINNVNEGLYRLDKDQKAIPGMATEAPQKSEDGLTYTMKLREDAKWSNGEPVTANDFVFAWQRALNPDTASPYGPYMMIGKIANADKVYDKSAKPEELGVKAIDEHTLEVKLVKPIEYFDTLMAFPSFYPQNKKFVEEKGDKFGTNAENLVFNGPFKMTAWGGPTATEWTLEKNADYWGAKDVTLEKIQFNVSKDPQASVNAFEANEADRTPKLATAAIISQYEGDKQMQRFLESSVWWIKMNEKNPALANKNIRRAIALAVDKKALVDDVLQNGSIVADGVVPREFVSDDSGKDFRDTGKYLEPNKDEAKKLFAQGMKEIGKKDLTLGYVTQDTETAKLEASFVKEQLEKTLEGLKIEVKNVPFKIRLDLEDKMDYDLLNGGWGPDYLNPMTYLDLWVTDGPQNKMGYSNPKYDELIKKADATTDKAEQYKLFTEAEKTMLEDDVALSPLYQRAVNVLIKEKVEGMVYHPIGGEYSYQWVKIKGE
ncbi:peptide ABC transporter substrate-binding protein [Bacillus sp. FJAT-42376]|uniref:peptide ABC transporter substrate-binding protein n=1 Tax=Bacillus sp. FJAT-42376 TaxID=2014076 RepID=UPI000F4F65B7|nr:peptide ABC transporter substrate-binding protein [Bacillus sp. FJAT-42376]AZB42358.1 peptide ABC transporter substrate-binding protein [Bacillus sp. FJAT-42376]